MSASEAISRRPLRPNGRPKSQNEETTTPESYDTEYGDSAHDDHFEQEAQNFRAPNAKRKSNVVSFQQQQNATAHNGDDGEEHMPLPLQAPVEPRVVFPRRTETRTHLSEEQKLSIVREYYDLKKAHGLVTADGDHAELPVFKYLWAKHGHLGRTLHHYQKFRKSVLKWLRRYKQYNCERIPDRRGRLLRPLGDRGRSTLCDAMHAEIQRLLHMDSDAGCDISSGVVVRRAEKLLDELRASSQAAEHLSCCLTRPFTLNMAERQLRILFGTEGGETSRIHVLNSCSRKAPLNPSLKYGTSESYAKRLFQLKQQQNARAVFARRPACVCISDIVREKVEREHPGMPATDANVTYIRDQMQLLLTECKANGQHTACCVDPDKFTSKMAYTVRCHWKADDDEKAEICIGFEPFIKGLANGADRTESVEEVHEPGIGYRYYDDGEGFAFAEPASGLKQPATTELIGSGRSAKRSRASNMDLQPNKDKAPLIDEDYAEDQSDDADEAVENSTSPVDDVMDEDYAEDENDEDDKTQPAVSTQSRRVASPVNRHRTAQQQQAIPSRKKRVSWNMNGNNTKYIDSAVQVRREHHYDIRQQRVQQPPEPISNVSLLQLLSHAFDAADSCMQLLSSYSSFAMVSTLPEDVRSSIATMLRGVETELEAAVGRNDFDGETNKSTNVPLSTLNNCLTMMKQTSQTMSLVCPRMQQPHTRIQMVQTVKNLVDFSLQAA